MAAELTTGKTYAGLKGIDTVTDKGYTNIYNNTGLAANDLLVALRGSNNSETVRAEGYLGGLAGFNSLRGTIDTSATGQWFVYSDMRQRHPPSAVLSARTNPTSQTKACWTLW